MTDMYGKLDLAAFLDRSNIGNAETAGMGEYLGYNDEQYSVSIYSRQLLEKYRVLMIRCSGS